MEIRKMGMTTPIFVVSGYAHDPIMSKPTEYGFTGSICKPFMLDDLAALLNKYLV